MKKKIVGRWGQRCEFETFILEWKGTRWQVEKIESEEFAQIVEDKFGVFPRNQIEKHNQIRFYYVAI